MMVFIRWIFVFAFAGCAVHSPAIHGGKIAFAPDARSDLTGLRIMDAVSGSVEIAKVGGKWVLSESGFPVDPEKLNSALQQIFGLAGQQGRRVAGMKSPEEVEVYGLTLDRAKIVDLIFGKQEIRLRLGMAGEDFETTYWSLEDEDRIYRADSSRAWGLSASPTFWKSRIVLPKFGPGNDLKELSVSWIDSAQNSRSYRLVRVGMDSAVIVGQETLGMPTKKALELIGHARQFLADDFLEPSEGKMPDPATQIDTPLVSVEVVLENGDRLSTRAIKGDSEHYFASNPSGHWVKVLKWRFKALMVSNASLTSGIQMGPEEDDGTDSYKVAPGFGIFMPHTHDTKETSDIGDSKHDHGHSDHGHDHSDHEHGHDHSGDKHDH